MTYKERNAGVKENEQPGYYISLAKGYMQKAYEEYSRITGNEFAPRIKKQDPKIEAIGQRLKKEMMELARVVEKAGFGETEFYRNVLYAAGDLIKDSSNLEGFFAAWNGYFSKEISESEFSSSGKTQLRIRQNIESMANPEKRKAAYEFLKNYAVQMNKKNGTKEDGFPEHVFFDDGNMRMTVRYSEETGRLVLRAYAYNSDGCAVCILSPDAEPYYASEGGNPELLLKTLDGFESYGGILPPGMLDWAKRLSGITDEEKLARFKDIAYKLDAKLSVKITLMDKSDLSPEGREYSCLGFYGIDNEGNRFISLNPDLIYEGEAGMYSIIMHELMHSYADPDGDNIHGWEHPQIGNWKKICNEIKTLRRLCLDMEGKGEDYKNSRDYRRFLELTGLISAGRKVPEWFIEGANELLSNRMLSEFGIEQHPWNVIYEDATGLASHIAEIAGADLFKRSYLPPGNFEEVVEAYCKKTGMAPEGFFGIMNASLTPAEALQKLLAEEQFLASMTNKGERDR